MPKLISIDTNAGTSRIFNGHRFSGTAVIYAATPDDHTSFQCDFELDTLIESRPEEVRSQRILRKQAGVMTPRTKRNQLVKELIIILGPEVSANDAVAALERLADIIRRKGMLIGRDDQEEFVVETFGPNPKWIR